MLVSLSLTLSLFCFLGFVLRLSTFTLFFVRLREQRRKLIRFFDMNAREGCKRRKGVVVGGVEASER